MTNVFTGIINDIGEVVEVREQAEGLRRLAIACSYDVDTIALGASIACCGPCLTVVERGRRGKRPFFAVDVAAETLRVTTAGMARLTLRAPPALSRFIAPKGSVALDGVSLTVNEVANDDFSVLIIPHTLEVTTFGALQSGSRLNLEVDQMARYAARLMGGARPAD